MISSLFKPRNTFLSVANEIGKGLEEKTVYLTDKDLVEDGYEIHEYEGMLYSLEVPLVSLSVTLSYLIATVSTFLVGEKYKTVHMLIFLNLAAIWPLILYRVHRTKKRFITKKTSRSL